MNESKLIGYVEGLNEEQRKAAYASDILEDIFVDGKLIREQSLSEIRELLWKTT
jgi:hypothetical protein